MAAANPVDAVSSIEVFYLCVTVLCETSVIVCRAELCVCCLFVVCCCLIFVCCLVSD